MMNANQPVRLIIFDVDGTLIDSQDFILAAMRRAFARAGRPAPSAESTLGIVGLSLPQAMEVLVPSIMAADRDWLVQLYKDSFRVLRDLYYTEKTSPFRPGDDPAHPADRPEPSGRVSLGPERYYVLGDNSSHSTDSRDFGPVETSEIVGRPVAVVWPLSRVRGL